MHEQPRLQRLDGLRSLMDDGQPILIKRVEAAKLVVELAGREHHVLMVHRESPCTHDALKAGPVLMVRIPAPAEKPWAAAGGTRVETPCGCTFILLPDPFGGR